MKHLASTLAIAILILNTGQATAALSNPEDLIKRVDEIRNPSESYEMKIEVRNQESSDLSVFEVSLKGNAKTLVKTLDPPRDRGRNMLMLEEEMWAYIPNLRRAVRVSLSQKLTGQAANGDISRMRWSGDYAPVLEKEDAKFAILLLTARKKGLTYEKVRAWIEKATFRPIQAEFLTPAGKVLKRANYGGYKMIAGKIRPTEIQIRDAVKEKDSSTLRILSMNIKNFPESLFNQNSLK